MELPFFPRPSFRLQRRPSRRCPPRICQPPSCRFRAEGEAPKPSKKTSQKDSPTGLPRWLPRWVFQDGFSKMDFPRRIFQEGFSKKDFPRKTSQGGAQETLPRNSLTKSSSPPEPSQAQFFLPRAGLEKSGLEFSGQVKFNLIFWRKAGRRFPPCLAPSALARGPAREPFQRLWRFLRSARAGANSAGAGSGSNCFRPKSGPGEAMIKTEILTGRKPEISFWRNQAAAAVSLPNRALPDFFQVRPRVPGSRARPFSPPGGFSGNGCFDFSAIVNFSHKKSPGRLAQYRLAA